MTKKFDIHIHKKELMEHKELIIMLKLVEHYNENGDQPIRYSRLREPCNDLLNELTEYRYDFGGSFDTYINNLHRDGFLVREKASPKRTFIIPDIAKIKSHLQKKEIIDSLNTMNLVQKEFDLKLLSRLLGDAYFETYLDKPMDISNQYSPRQRPSTESIRYLNYIWEAFGIEVCSNPSPYKIMYAYPHEKTFHLDEKTVKDLLKIGDHIAKINNDPTYSVAPFKIILEFRDVSLDREEINIRSKKISECFVRWANEFHNIAISNEDLLSLTNKKDNISNPEIKSLYTEFMVDMMDAERYQMDKL
jgi:hypothetical protein